MELGSHIFVYTCTVLSPVGSQPQLGSLSSILKLRASKTSAQQFRMLDAVKGLTLLSFEAVSLTKVGMEEKYSTHCNQSNFVSSLKLLN